MRPVIITACVICFVAISTWIMTTYLQHFRPAFSTSPFSRSVSHNDHRGFAIKIQGNEPVSMTPDKTRQDTTKQDSNRSCSEAYQKNHWLTTNGNGRIGNMMFQFATLLATANATCRTPAVSMMMNRVLDPLFNISRFVKIDAYIQTKGWHKMTEKCRFSPELSNLDPNFNWTINGYLNSWKNFQSHTEYVKSSLTFNKVILDSARKFLSRDDIVEKCPLTKSLRIGIHIRRGDFLLLYNKGFRVASVDYTIKAREYFKNLFPDEALCFIVVSDDLGWCKNNIRGDNVFYSNLKTPGQDLALLSLCNHTIISTGTFGWFGAWLSGGRVVYYSDFPRRDTQRCPTNGADFIPPKWIGLP